MGEPLARRIGLGHRPELAADLLREPTVIGFCEIVAETCFTRRETRAEAAALTALWPVVPHGVKLSLGSADGLDEGRLGRLASLCRELGAPLVSEHVSFTRAGGAAAREIGHLTQLPRTREAVRVVARNVARARRRLPDIPLLLENVAWSVRWPEDEMDEPSFYQEVAAATGCPLLLDVGNLYANAVNEGLDPAAVLHAYPLDRVAMLHVAGGVVEHGFYFDTHADPIPDAVMALAGRALGRCPEAPVLVERDGNFGQFGGFAALRDELARLQALRPAARGALPSPRPAGLADGAGAAGGGLAGRQGALARLLTDVAPPAGAVAEGFGLAGLGRVRGILERKRVDDALPLLGRLGRRVDELRPLAEEVVRHRQRPPHGAGPADALAIAAAAASHPRLGDDAVHDKLLLRALFAGPDPAGALRPRLGPFLGSERGSDGARLHAWKGVGAFAAVHLQYRLQHRLQDDGGQRSWPRTERSRSPGPSSSG